MDPTINYHIPDECKPKKKQPQEAIIKRKMINKIKGKMNNTQTNKIDKWLIDKTIPQEL